MRTFLIALFLPALAIAAQTQPTTQAASTQPANAFEKIAVEMIKFVDDLNKTLNTVTDEATAKAALPKLEQAKKDVDKLKEATEKAGKPADDVMAKVMTKYGMQIQNSSAVMMANYQRIHGDAKLEAIVGKAMDELQLFQATVERE